MPYQKQKTLKGFSLGEVILSVAVLTVGLLPILSAMNGAFNTSRDSQNTVIAAGLAQEGVELVVNVRDNGAIRDASDAFEDFSNNFQTCRIEYDDLVLSAPTTNDIECGNTLSHDLTLNGSGFYAHAGAAGKFKRKIFIDYSNANHDAFVASVVYWGSIVPAFNNRTQFDDNATGLEVICTVANECVYSQVSLTSWK